VSEAPGLPARTIETTLRVRYAETDAMGVAHHASYIVWLEQGRTEVLRSCGLPYTAIEARGFFVVLSHLDVRYLASARYDDLVVVRVGLEAVRSRQVIFRYQLRLAERGTPLIEARSEHIVVDRATGRPARLPDDLLSALRGAGPQDKGG
jgi:acyl-CoA thioester hydrolase